MKRPDESGVATQPVSLAVQPGSKHQLLQFHHCHRGQRDRQNDLEIMGAQRKQAEHPLRERNEVKTQLNECRDDYHGEKPEVSKSSNLPEHPGL